MAFNKPTTVAVVNAETVAPILMGWTARGPSVAAARHTNQSGEKISHCPDLRDRRETLAAPR
jgi:hypothetical protein